MCVCGGGGGGGGGSLGTRLGGHCVEVSYLAQNSAIHIIYTSYKEASRVGWLF